MHIYIDTETYKFSQETGKWYPVLDAREFCLGYAETDKNEQVFFYNAEDMYQWLIAKIEKNIKYKKRTFIYAHNTEYDWYAIAKNHLLDKDMKYIVFKPFIGIYKEKGYFLDSYAFWKMSLQEAGEILEFPKLHMPEEVNSLEEIKPYLQRDVQIVRKAMERVKADIQKLGFSPRKLMTAGQLAITSFMTFSKNENIDYVFTELINKEGYKQKQVIKPKYPKMLREAFRGGDNRAFQTGKYKDCTLIDANGLYSYIMRDLLQFPDLKTEVFTKKPNPEMLKKYVKSEIGVARVKIKVPKGLKFPYLPIRYTKYQIFPINGEMRGTWTFTEIEKAIELGYEIIECDWCMRWQKSMINPLAKFIGQLYEIEKTDKEGYGRVIKLIRNNLFGKFSQYKTQKDYKLIERWEVEEYIQNGYISVSTVDTKYVMMKELDDYIPSYTNAIISIQITALARKYMYEQMSKIPLTDLLYTDTDSIMFKGNHINKFEFGTELGQFKLVKQGIAKILGEKRYYIDEEVKISGISKRDIKKEIIENELDVVTKRMIGLQKGIQEGKLNMVGGFEEEIMEMKIHNKIMLIVPDNIDEVRIEFLDNKQVVIKDEPTETEW